MKNNNFQDKQRANTTPKPQPPYKCVHTARTHQLPESANICLLLPAVAIVRTQM